MPTYSHDPRCECPECCRAARAELAAVVFRQGCENLKLRDEVARLRAALAGCEDALTRVAEHLRKESNTAYARFCDGGAKLARETLEGK